MALALGTNSGFVTVAPTADPAGTGVAIDGSSVITKDTSPADAATITEIGWYRASGTNGANFEVALYSDLAGVPVTRLFVDATNSDTGGGWVAVAVDWAISGSTAYWLALQMDAHGGSSTVDSASSGGSGSDVLTSQTTLNDPYGGGVLADADGMYAIYALVQAADTTDDLFANGVATGSPASTSTIIAQRHSLSGVNNSTGAPAEGTPTLSEVGAVDGLTAASIATAVPVLGTASIGQAHVLDAVAIAAGAPSLADSTITQIHVLDASTFATQSQGTGNPELFSGDSGEPGGEVADTARSFGGGRFYKKTLLLEDEEEAEESIEPDKARELVAIVKRTARKVEKGRNQQTVIVDGSALYVLVMRRLRLEMDAERARTKFERAVEREVARRLREEHELQEVLMIADQ